MIPTPSLVSPAQARCYRELDHDHVQSLKNEMAKFPTTKPLILGHIPGMDLKDVSAKDLTDGVIPIECIGGNHTRQAIQEILNDDPENQYVKHWPVRIYCGLTDSQALAKGYSHNRQHDTVKRNSFEDIVRYFRKELTSCLEENKLLNEDGSFSQIPHKVLISWKRRLAMAMLCESVS